MKSPNDVVIISAARTPIGKFGEAFKTLRAHELAAVVITEVLKRANLDGHLLDDIIFGDCCQCPDEANTARTGSSQGRDSGRGSGGDHPAPMFVGHAGLGFRCSTDQSR